MTLSPLEDIKERQREWAALSGRTLTPQGYCACEDDNIFGGLSQQARREFEDGDGKELGGKFRAPHSSSALACNWFDYWRQRDLAPLSRAFDVRFAEFIGLERKLPTGVGRSRANLDVLLKLSDGGLFGIESKFCEPYRLAGNKFVLHDKYFLKNRQRWTDVGLPGCQSVAESLRSDEHEFCVLDVAQLLKHMLALARTSDRWMLCCLWYDVPGPTADAHRRDVETFATNIGDDRKHFVALTYQELFAKMKPFIALGDADYFEYLRQRYIDVSAQP